MILQLLARRVLFFLIIFFLCNYWLQFYSRESKMVLLDCCFLKDLYLNMLVKANVTTVLIS